MPTGLVTRVDTPYTYPVQEPVHEPASVCGRTAPIISFPGQLLHPLGEDRPGRELLFQAELKKPLHRSAEPVSEV